MKGNSDSDLDGDGLSVEPDRLEFSGVHDRDLSRVEYRRLESVSA
jgi:hypothetical protein